METEMLDALRQAVLTSGEFGRVARAIKREFRWTISDRDAENRLSQWLSPSNRNRFPADALPIVVRICGDTVTPILLRAGLGDRKPARMAGDKGDWVQLPRRA